MKGDVKFPLTDYGIKVKTQLFRMGKSQNWLISEIKLNTGLYVDCSLLNKILTGRNNNEKIKSAIDEIIAEKSIN